MELNHILLFVAIVSPLVLIVRSHRTAAMNRGLRLAALVVLIVTGAAWFFFPEIAGYIGGTAWFVLLLVPAILSRKQVQSRTPLLGRATRITPVVLTLIIINVAMFGLEIALGGSENWLTLHRLGQLETSAFFFNHQYWRLLTSLFLHYGYLHLLFNIYALYVLGPALERSIGAVRFLACYLLAGLGAGLGVVTLYALGLTPPQSVVGASGSIMGVVGAWAGLLLRNRHAPLAARRLQSILIIVAIQMAFDLSTPQISMGAHICGLLSGLFLGLILAPRPLRV
jgi:membrane associated rhomboid family serine protease